MLFIHARYHFAESVPFFFLFFLEHCERVHHTGRSRGSGEDQYGHLLLHILHPGRSAGGGARQLPHQEGGARAAG